METREKIIKRVLTRQKTIKKWPCGCTDTEDCPLAYELNTATIKYRNPDATNEDLEAAIDAYWKHYTDQLDIMQGKKD